MQKTSEGKYNERERERDKYIKTEIPTGYLEKKRTEEVGN